MRFEDLTWDDLSSWAGRNVVKRGKAYRHAVEDVRVTDDGRLLAWVRGGDRYATAVGLDDFGGLWSVCTCPYGGACKHAVATLLVHLDNVQAGGPTQPADADDPRMARLMQDAREMGAQRVDDRHRDADDEAALGRYLESLDTPALVRLVSEFPEVRQRLLELSALQRGKVADVVAATLDEIEELSAEPAWWNHWRDEGHLPDYSPVRGRLEALLAAGYADEVVSLGEALLHRGMEQIGRSDDDGETGRQIAECLEIVLQALASSSLSGPERILWDIDARLEDQYGLLDSISGPEEDGDSSPADWSPVADELAARLSAMSASSAHQEHPAVYDYRRKQLLLWLVTSLEQAHRQAEIAPLLEREAEATLCYVELVDHLLGLKQDDAAAEWARIGFLGTLGKAPGIAWMLEERLRELAQRRQDLPLAGAFRAMEFFSQPDAKAYAAVREVVRPVGLWDTVRRMLLLWLETGSRPDVADSIGGPDARSGAPASPPSEPADDVWPLPPTGLGLGREKGRPRDYPDTETLIDIAIQEGRHDDVLRWYRHPDTGGAPAGGYLGVTVADAVQETHPDEALCIWKAVALWHIALVRPDEYERAGAILAKMKQVYQRTDRMAEWDSLLAELRLANARRPRMIGVLDALEGKRTRIVGR